MAAAPITGDMLAQLKQLKQLKQLGELKAAGVPTEPELEAQKARILAG